MPELAKLSESLSGIGQVGNATERLGQFDFQHVLDRRDFGIRSSLGCVIQAIDTVRIYLLVKITRYCSFIFEIQEP